MTTAPSSIGIGLRAELDRFALALGRQRTFRTRVYVGTPGAEKVLVHDGVPLLDHGLRTDLVDRGLEGLEHNAGACLWLTRAGDLAPREEDTTWLLAARSGFARHGLEPAGVFVLTRRGWREVASGETVPFHRVRRR